MEKEVLLSEKLDAGYDGRAVVSDISFALKEGEICALIGSNGSGKSTVIKTMARLLTPVSGRVSIMGRDLASFKDMELARILSCMFPAAPRTEWLTCRDMVENGRYPYTGMMGILSAKDREKTEEAMELVGVTELAGRFFNTLSDGQKQRVMLARALCQEPKILLLDEPASFLDIKYKFELLELIEMLAGKKGIAVLFSMHEISLAGRISDKMICLKDGRVDRIDKPSAIMQREYIEGLYELKEGSLKEGEFNDGF